MSWPWKRPESPLEQKVDRVLSDTDQLIQMANLTNQKLDKIISLLETQDVAGFAGKWGTPIKQEKE